MICAGHLGGGGAGGGAVVGEPARAEDTPAASILNTRPRPDGNRWIVCFRAFSRAASLAPRLREAPRRCRGGSPAMLSHALTAAPKTRTPVSLTSAEDLRLGLAKLSPELFGRAMRMARSPSSRRISCRTPARGRCGSRRSISPGPTSAPGFIRSSSASSCRAAAAVAGSATRSTCSRPIRARGRCPTRPPRCTISRRPWPARSISCPGVP